MAFNFQITSTAQIAPKHGVKVLVYGRAGVGKTRLVVTTPRPFLISAESGLLSLRNHNIPVVELATIEQLEDIHRFFKESEEAKNYDTICIDSLTEIGEVILSNSKPLVKDQRLAYNIMMDKMHLFIRDFRDLKGKHVYFAAQEESVEIKTNVSILRAAMPGHKMGGKTPYHFDEVFRMEIKNDNNGVPHRVLRTKANYACEAKDRSDALNELEPAHLGKIFNKILAAPPVKTKEKK